MALRRASAGEKAAAPGETTLLLRYKPPYDWPAMLGYFGPRMIAGVETIENGVYRRAIALQGEHGIVAVELAEADALKVRVRFPKLSVLPNIIARLRRVFDLAADPQAVALDLGKDATLAPLVAHRPGLRLPGAWDGFEMAARAILGQQVTVAGAARLAARLTERFGEKLRCADPVLTRVFPEPAALAEADLAGLGLTRARAESLKKLAAAAAVNPHLFSAALSLEEAQSALRALPGVGDWTAQYIAMRLLREPDAFPAADIGLRRALADRDGARPTPKTLLARAENWRPWRAYAAQHLWTAEGAMTAKSREFRR
ncbi:DNA-3-methyladenine glycosylase 2 family protein [Rhodoblastus acidophilus]|uniref:DNA-3-methyladenine glycosylase II n=2 Tax=Candidatus Rhodoblastus alkanivorans TaxID=2954117 RepID=A0ABS9Z9L9_9HYPH|nr:AlkA N-terminal domain-containing protein [Candidatus Rhodoblastus alkanivorans]MCI4678002.1 DNA-3-methyladenine glycosylase 2 family protein [Candidatus Rhodoblastus alkanivorans]MCI4683897.1 DNA-3-methyladenine glycosylase 2 family protein [Candidatus Rhodoblastus alkanivorans]MDI4641215.1 DNA-3-methyladenine glycosylase 2 family protein [Rhodoblastus acidophilus]